MRAIGGMLVASLLVAAGCTARQPRTAAPAYHHTSEQLRPGLYFVEVQATGALSMGRTMLGLNRRALELCSSPGFTGAFELSDVHQDDRETVTSKATVSGRRRAAYVMAAGLQGYSSPGTPNPYLARPPAPDTVTTTVERRPVVSAMVACEPEPAVAHADAPPELDTGELGARAADETPPLHE